MTEDELIDDAECISRLRFDPERPPIAEKRSVIYSYRFPTQDFKLRVGDRPLIAETLDAAGEVVQIDEDSLEISLKLSNKKEPPPQAISLIPDGPLDDKVLRAAIARYLEAMADGHQDRYAALTGILRCDFPRFCAPVAVSQKRDDVARAIDAIARLDRSHLLIQGPPGAGKTYTSSHAIVQLLARGNRVGVSSNSRKAINNLLAAVEKVASCRALRFRGVKKSSSEDQFLNGTMVEDTTNNVDATEGGHNLIAGTAWLFAREELEPDYES